MKKFGIIGCGFLGNIVADAWKNGLLSDYTLLGVTSRSEEKRQKTADRTGCKALSSVDELLELKPDILVETASVEAVRDNAVKILGAGCDLAVISIGAFADGELYDNAVKAAQNGNSRLYLASGAVGGFDVLQTVSLMAQAQKLEEKAGICTHTGAKGFKNTPVWKDSLLTDSEKSRVFTGNAKQAIATFPRRVNVAVATSLATAGPQNTEVTMYSVPGWTGDDHKITAQIDGVKAVVDIESGTSAIAGWSLVAMLRNITSPVCFY